MSVPYHIRELRTEDLEQAAALEAACFSMPWKYKDFEEILTNKNRIYMAAVLDSPNAEGQTVIGGCVLTDITGEGDISNVAVHSAYRRRHVAQALLRELIRVGRQQRGIHTFILEVRSQNAPAIGLYERLGFCSAGVRPNFYEKPKDDAIIMRLTDAGAKPPHQEREGD
ncbi:MAG: ribosomal protein S18-alanine N-acetyltransferase [Roseburia sp.]|nr:ribosomal protein S18-alanine N-acetyltransferase [Roseburia sp.]